VEVAAGVGPEGGMRGCGKDRGREEFGWAARHRPRIGSVRLLILTCSRTRFMLSFRLQQ
jgi:hypothetical protein